MSNLQHPTYHQCLLHCVIHVSRNDRLVRFNDHDKVRRAGDVAFDGGDDAVNAALHEISTGRRVKNNLGCDSRNNKLGDTREEEACDEAGTGRASK